MANSHEQRKPDDPELRQRVIEDTIVNFGRQSTRSMVQILYKPGNFEIQQAILDRWNKKIYDKDTANTIFEIYVRRDDFQKLIPYFFSIPEQERDYQHLEHLIDLILKDHQAEAFRQENLAKLRKAPPELEAAAVSSAKTRTWMDARDRLTANANRAIHQENAQQILTEVEEDGTILSRENQSTDDDAALTSRIRERCRNALSS